MVKAKRFSKRKKTLLIAPVVFASSTSLALLYGYGPAEAWTAAQIAALEAANIEAISSFAAEFGEQLTSSFNDIASAIAVATKQEALDAQSISDASRVAGQQLVSAIQAQEIAAAVIKAHANYDSATGQGFDPCGTYAKNKTLDRAFSENHGRAVSRIGQLDNSSGRLANSADAAGKRLRERREKFCTDSEAAAGICSRSRLPAGDSNAELFFQSAAPNSLEADARKMYIENLLGEPDGQLKKEAGRSAAGQAYFVTKNQKDSVQSISAYSLASIDAANTQIPELDNKSPNEVMQLRVNSYFGGEEAKEWAGSLAAQTERGLLVEYAKMTGLGVWMQHQKYKQNQRILLNVAGLVSASVETDRENLLRIYEKSQRSNVKSVIGQGGL